MNLHRWLSLLLFFSLDHHAGGVHSRRGDGVWPVSSKAARHPDGPTREPRLARCVALLQRVSQRLRRELLELSPRSQRELRVLWFAFVMTVTSFGISMLIASLGF